MGNIFKKVGYLSVLSSLLFLLLGIFLIINPTLMAQTVFYIIGGVFLILGFSRIISYLISRAKGFYENYSLISGSIYCLIGLFIIIFGIAIISFFSVIIGVWIIVNGINRINFSFKMKDSGIKYWILSLIISIVMVIAGVYIIFIPGTLLATLGIILVIYSVMEIIENILFLVNVKKL